MPKELHEIKNFVTGTVSTPVETDIPDDAASYSINIDPVAEDGILKGIPDDLTLTAGGFVSAAQPEITTVECVADVSDSLNAKYFDIDTDGGQKTEIWFDTDNSGTSAPTGSGSYNDVIEVTQVGTNDSAERVAVAIASAINEDAGAHSTAEVSGITVIITDASNAAVTSATMSAGDTGFTVTQKQAGASGASGLGIAADKMAMINDDGTHRVVYFDDADDKIKKIDDIHGTSVGTGNLSGSAESKTGLPTMQVNNKEVHIGMGKGVTDRARWCGIPQYKQFGVSTTALTLENAELDTPSPFSDFTKVVTDGTYIYAFKRGDTYLYKFKISTGRLELRSGANWASIKSICMHATDSNFLWVYDNDTDLTYNYSLDKVSTDNLEVSEEYLFDAEPEVTGGASPAAVDILHTADNTSTYGYMWCFGYDGSHNPKGYHWELPAFGTAINTTAGASAPNLRSNVVNTPGSAMWYDLSGTPQWRKFNYGSTTGNDFSFPTGAFLFKPSGGLQTKSYCGMYWIFRPEWTSETASNDCYYVFANGGTSTGGAHSATRFQISSSDDYAVPQGVIFRDDYPDLGEFGDADSIIFQIPFDAAKADYGDNINANYADHRTMNGTNDDTTFVSARNQADNDESDYYTFTNPAYNIAQGGSVADISAITTDSELKYAVGVVDKDVSTVKVHIFEGDGSSQARWAYGTIASPEAQLETFIKLTPTHAATGGTLTHLNTYYYKASFVYDGYQESPLTHQVLLTHDPSASATAAKNTITIDFKGLAVLPKRITHLNIYVAESDDAASEPEGFYRLLENIPIDYGWATISDATATTVFNSTYRQKTIIDIGKRTGASYEALVGISELVQDTMPNYSLSAQLNNHQFIADCYHPDLQSVPNYMFKSKPYNFDQFDWSVDLLRLPTKPIALASFNGRIYAFDENNTYRIEPNSFYIEDTYEGVGCLGPESVIVTEYGMCFADKNNIYLHDGRQPVPIGEPVLTDSTFGLYGWYDKKDWDPKIMFDAKRNSFVVLSKFGALNHYFAWAFNIARKRWDFWQLFTTSEPKGILAGKNGEMFISDGTNLKYYLGHATTTRHWSWHSKKLTMDQDTQAKVFKKTRVTGNTGDSIDTFVSSEGTPTDSGATDGALDYVYTLSGAASRAKWIQYKITAETNTVDAIGTVFRRRPIR